MHKTSVETALETARKMPPLSHYRHGHSFDIMRSDACAWLIAQPAVRQLCWNLCKAALVLDIKTGKWRGSDSTQADGRLNE
jgi:hypothetical protein